MLQVSEESYLNLVSPCHVPSVCLLQLDCVFLDHIEHSSGPFGFEVGLNDGNLSIQVFDAFSHHVTFELLLDFLSSHVLLHSIACPEQDRA